MRYVVIRRQPAEPVADSGGLITKSAVVDRRDEASIPRRRGGARFDVGTGDSTIPKGDGGDDNSFLKPAGVNPSALERAAPREPGLHAEAHNLNHEEAAEYRSHGDIAVLSMPLTLIRPMKAKNTTPAATAWGLEATGVRSSKYSGKGVTIAVLDTGIDRDHEAFWHIQDRMELMDFTATSKGVDGNAPDAHGHGTHVAGTLFGQIEGEERIGVAPGVSRVLVGKVLGGKGASYDGCYNAIEWAMREEADVISLSLGLDFDAAVAEYMTTDGLPRKVAVARALEAYRQSLDIFDSMAELIQSRRGALLVAASGNASQRNVDLRYTIGAVLPASVKGFLPVGAVRATGIAAAKYNVADFSNTGCVLCAPGESVLSAKREGGLTTMSGTSMATPHVAVIAALWIEKRFNGGSARPRGWTDDVRDDMIANCMALPYCERADVGRGLVQAPQ